MSTLIETSYTTILIQFIKGNKGLLSQILTATVSATIIGFSLKKLHKIGYFSIKGIKQVEWKRVGTVEKLTLYPLKGAKGIDVDAGYFGAMGMISADGLHDRSFVLVDEKNNDSMWANRLPKLVFIEMIKINGSICVKAPGMDDLVINNKDLEYEKSKEISSKMQDVHIKLILCGDVYDEWFSTYLKGKSSGIRLAYHYSDSPVGSGRPVRPKYQNKYGFTKDDIPKIAFATSYSLFTWESLKDLNQKLDKPVSELNFRANLVIQPDEKTPFIEDKWQKRLRIGDTVILHYAKPCHRCIVIQTDPETGKLIANGEPMKTLKSYRMIEPALGSPIFANQYGIDICGTVKVGDEIFAEM